MPLKGIPHLISPELLYALASMGHGDEIVLADSNFPSESIARTNGARLILCDGVPIPKLLRQILKLFPLDQYTAQPVALMDLVDSDKKKGLDVPIWNEYKQLVGQDVQFEMVERFQFYERAKTCFAVVRKYFKEDLLKFRYAYSQECCFARLIKFRDDRVLTCKCFSLLVIQTFSTHRSRRVV
jgi:L-fucose mutarotase